MSGLTEVLNIGAMWRAWNRKKENIFFYRTIVKKI